MKLETRLMILRITELQVVSPYLLRLSFNDGTRKTVDVFPLLDGPVFEALKDPALFAGVRLDPLTGTAAWPNEVDLAPESLHDLSAVEETSAA
jgi:hypothetical protein